MGSAPLHGRPDRDRSQSLRSQFAGKVTCWQVFTVQPPLKYPNNLHKTLQWRLLCKAVWGNEVSQNLKTTWCCCQPPFLRCSTHRLSLLPQRKDGLAGEEEAEEEVCRFPPLTLQATCERKRERHRHWERNFITHYIVTTRAHDERVPLQRQTFACSSWLSKQGFKLNQQQNISPYGVPALKQQQMNQQHLLW